MSPDKIVRLLVTPGKPLRGEIRVAADKSISHRAVMLSAIASGTSRVQNLLEGEDVLATIGAFRQMGVSIDQVGAGAYIIKGVGLRGLRQPASALDMGNSGTALRLMAGLLCGQIWPSTLTGDASLRARPMGRIIEPLRQMGAEIASTTGDDRPPLTISPASRLRGIHYAMPVASAQVKSCLLLAGLYAEGETSVAEPWPTRDHTECMLAGFGRPPVVSKGQDGKGQVTLHGNPNGGGELRACEIRVPADLSSAAFFLVGASIIPGSDLLLRGVGVNPSRNGVLAILAKMGADIELRESSESSAGEPLADLRIRAADLRGCTISGGEVASAIDEIPAIATAAACARGVTEIRDAGELRVKESDRIHSVVAGLNALGVAVEEHADGLTITGGSLSGGRVESHGDHRIAMAFAIAGGAADGPVEVADCANIATSFPEFCQIARHAGLDIHES